METNEMTTKELKKVIINQVKKIESFYLLSLIYRTIINIQK